MYIADALICASGLGFSYNKAGLILKDVSAEIPRGSFSCVIGRNGSGKSTFVKILSGIYSGYLGTVIYNDEDIRNIPAKKLASVLAFIPQYSFIQENNISVYEFLTAGRYSYKKFTDFFYDSGDFSAISAALDILGITELRDRLLSGLSGGERQKVLIALALVQLDISSDLRGKTLIIDEPLTYLDVNYQFEIFNVLSKLNREKGLTVIAVIHDLNMSIKFTGFTLLMESGRIIRAGKTIDIITEESIGKYFMINAQIVNFENEFHINFIPTG